MALVLFSVIGRLLFAKKDFTMVRVDEDTAQHTSVASLPLQHIDGCGVNEFLLVEYSLS